MAAPIDLEYPFVGRWLVQNSPADRVPSHGTSMFASTYAIDFVPVGDNGRTAPITFGSLVRPELPERFPGFGRPILAPVDGLVLAVRDAEPDHAAHRGLPSIRYALTQRGRAAAGWVGLAGNHVLIEYGDVVVALCHLQHGSSQFGQVSTCTSVTSWAGAGTPATAPSRTSMFRRSATPASKTLTRCP